MRPLAKLRPIALAGPPEVAVAAQVHQQRLGAVEIAGLDEHRQLVARPPRRGGVQIQRIAEARRFARDRGERADARASGDRSRRPARSRAASTTPRSRATPPGPSRPPAAGPPGRRRRASPPAPAGSSAAATRRTPSGISFERVLEPRAERLVVEPPRLVLGQDDEQRIDAGLDRTLLEQVGAEAVDGADVRLFEVAQRVFERLRARPPAARRVARASSRAPAAAAASARRRPSR